MLQEEAVEVDGEAVPDYSCCSALAIVLVFYHVLSAQAALGAHDIQVEAG